MEECAWDLTQIYENYEDPKILKDISFIEEKKKSLLFCKETKKFNNLYLRSIWNTYVSVLNRLYKLKSYAVLSYLESNNADSVGFYQKIIPYASNIENVFLNNFKIKLQKKQQLLGGSNILENKQEKLPSFSEELMDFYDKTFLLLYDQSIGDKKICAFIINSNHGSLNLVARNFKLSSGLEYYCKRNNIDPKISQLISNKIISYYQNDFINKKKEIKNNSPHIPYSEKLNFSYSKEVVFRFLEEISGVFSHIGKNFFKERKINCTFKQKGNTTSSLSYQTSPNIGPYILLNLEQENWLEDTFILAHEIGHGIHQVLAGQNSIENYLILESVNEINSIFMEILLLDYVSKKLKNEVSLSNVSRFAIDRIDKIFFKQVFYHNFEYTICLNRREAILSIEEIEKIWIDNQRLFYGTNKDDFIESTRGNWCFIPHFFRHTFYIQFYPICFCLAIHLFLLYKKDQNKFMKRYLNLLSRGSDLNIDLICKKMDIDITSDLFWEDIFRFLEHVTN